MLSAQKKTDAGHSVHKIGGTSMTQVEAVMDNILVGNRSEEELYNRVFVVSAYGGFTDLLLENKKTGEAGVYQLYAGSETDWAWGDALTKVADKMCAINEEIFGDAPELKLANAFVQERVEGTRSCLMDLHRLCSFGHFKLEKHLLTVREMLSAIGESHSAHNTMLLLRAKGVNAVFADLSGWREPEASTLDGRISKVFDDIDLSSQLAIATGYAQCSEGLMSIYGRGYSEVTFSRIACLTQAREAIIHKEFHLSSADPRIVGEDAVRPIGRTSYDVADQLSNMGMEAIHPRAAKGLRQNDIPLRIANTFEPEHPGTVIDDHWDPENSRVEIVTGVPTAFEIEVFNQDMVGIPGSEESILSVLKRYKVPTVTKNLNANTITHYVSAPLKQIRRCVDEIEEKHPEATVQTRKVAIVSVIGANIDQPGLFARAVTVLDEAGVELVASHFPSRRVDLQFVVAEGDFNKAIVALHRGLVEGKKEEGASDKKTKNDSANKQDKLKAA
ncbi:MULTISPECIES: aspartate kinase [Thalassospira]|uniref:aspartate kinase n=1 Tax=Thalassospira TaxID=168934 RepID=UPI000C0EEA4C|nr:aspartate kinase [Thalassospira sp. GB04J01]MBV17363.1 aspartate kinase [Thalassospira sp.]|tara:strand:- start:81474 stop:82979 length:1506 start_codon:yes stop_codon:yes gene_type:complete